MALKRRRWLVFLRHSLCTRGRWVGRAMSLAVILLLAHGSTDTRAIEVTEAELKAAFIYSFAKFTEWPDASDEIRLCLLDEHALNSAAEALDGKPLGGRRLKVRRLTSTQEATGCQILFLSESQRDNLPRLIKLLQGVPTLTVTDAEGLAEQGVMIELSRQDDRIVFEVNITAARRARLDISAKLLRLARRVH